MLCSSHGLCAHLTSVLSVVAQHHSGWPYWAVPAIFNFILTTVQLVVFFRMRKSSGSFTTLMFNLVASGVSYFAVTFSISIITLGFTFASDPAMTAVTIGLQQALSSLMSCRLVLNLRDPNISTRTFGSDLGSGSRFRSALLGQGQNSIALAPVQSSSVGSQKSAFASASVRHQAIDLEAVRSKPSQGFEPMVHDSSEKLPVSSYAL